MKLILTGVIENIGTRQDGSVKLVLGANEMDSKQVGDLFQLRNQFVKCLLSDTNITPLEESLVNEENIKDGKKVKTKSQRLRAVLFRIHEQEKTSLTFDQWYDNKMESLIEHYRSKLD